MADLERALRDLAAAEEWPPTPDIAAAVTVRLRQAPAPAGARPAAACAPALGAGDRPGGAGRAAGRRGRVPGRARRRARVARPQERRGAAHAAAAAGARAAAPAGPRPRRAARHGGGADRLRAARADHAREPGRGARAGPQAVARLPADRRAPGDARRGDRRADHGAARYGVIAEKAVGPGTEVRAVDVDGARGAWLDGEPHAIIFQDTSGNYREDVPRLAGDTLVWERDGLVLRIEGARDLEDALAIARSLR